MEISEIKLLLKAVWAFIFSVLKINICKASLGGVRPMVTEDLYMITRSLKMTLLTIRGRILILERSQVE